MLSCRALRPTVPLKIWFFVCAAAIAIHLGGPPLIDADEGRNAEVAREMAATNDYVVPRLNTLPYLDKPIVYFASAAVMMEILGSTELAARLPAYLFTLATAGLVFWFARRRIGEEEAWVSAIAFLAMPLTIAFARTVIFDSALTFFIVAAIIALSEAIDRADAKWTAVAWASMAFGVLTKGPVALAVPLLVTIPFALRQKAFRRLWSLAGIALFVAIIAPWLWAVSREVPDFLHYVLVTETASRLATDELNRTAPWWYFAPYLVAGAAPWSVTAMSRWREWHRRDPFLMLLLFWLLAPLLLFSISQSKRPQYILPLMPAIALLIGWCWRSIRFRATGIAVAAFGCVLIGASQVPALRQRLRPELLESVPSTAIVVGVLLTIAGVIAAISQHRQIGLFALSLPVVALPVVANPLMVSLGDRRSTRSVVSEISRYVTPQTEIIGVDAFTGSMAFYLRRPLIVATDDWEEFTSNYLVRRNARFRDAPGSPVRSIAWFIESLRQCCTRRIYIIRDDDPHHQQPLEASGARLIATGAHHLFYLRDGAGP